MQESEIKYAKYEIQNSKSEMESKIISLSISLSTYSCLSVNRSP